MKIGSKNPQATKYFWVLKEELPKTTYGFPLFVTHFHTLIYYCSSTFCDLRRRDALTGLETIKNEPVRCKVVPAMIKTLPTAENWSRVVQTTDTLWPPLWASQKAIWKQGLAVAIRAAY